MGFFDLGALDRKETCLEVQSRPRVRTLRADIIVGPRARDAAKRVISMRLMLRTPSLKTIEASLQLSEAMLIGLALPTG